MLRNTLRFAIIKTFYQTKIKDLCGSRCLHIFWLRQSINVVRLGQNVLLCVAILCSNYS